MDQQDLHDDSTVTPELRSQPAATNTSSPIHLMPTELLLKIFGHRVEEDIKSLIRAQGPYFGSIDHRQGAWLLSKVCREWRNVIISTATFWCNIIFTSDSSIPMRKYEDACFFRLVELQLKRSRGFGLNIRLQRRLEWSNDRLQALARMMVQHHQRWKELALENNEAQIFHNAILLSGFSLPLSFPLLEFLELEGYHRRLPMGNPLLIESSSLAPALERASFVGCHPSPNFPWERLRILSILELRSSFVHILPQLTHLENMTVRFCYSWPSSHSPRITLPKLETLIIKTGGQEILDLIRSPALKELDMQAEPIDRIPDSRVITFVNESRCSVETFSCYMKTSVKIEFRRLLETMPELRSLSVGFVECGPYPYPDELAFQALGPLREQEDAGLSTFCPLLEYLSITYYTMEARSDPERGYFISAFVDVLERRCGRGSRRDSSGGNRLKRAVLELVIRCGPLLRDLDISADDRRRVSKLEEEGLGFTFIYDD